MPRLSRTLIVFLCVLALARPALAFAPYAVAGIAWLVEAVGIPVSYALGCGLAYSPPIRVFGTERSVYGFDFGSMACHAENVYGLQLSLCGGVVEEDLWGLQLGVLATGYASRELLFGDYHFFNSDYAQMNGLQFGTFAAKTSTVNGLQSSAIYAEAQTVNGLQVGFVNRATRLHGLQIGVCNLAERGLGLQVGVVNFAGSGAAACFPLLNVVY